MTCNRQVIGMPTLFQELDKKTAAQPEKDKFLISFFIVFNRCFKCRFEAWQMGLLQKFADCVSVS